MDVFNLSETQREVACEVMQEVLEQLDIAAKLTLGEVAGLKAMFDADGDKVILVQPGKE